jgi:hypothetical protein
VFLSWWQAAAIAGGLLFLSVVVPGRVRPWLREAGVVMALFTLWQWSLDRFGTSTRGAVAHGMWVWRLERRWHLPSERSIQRFVLRAPDVMRALNYYYAVVHVQDVMVVLIWLFWRHRHRYRRARTSLILVTLGTLLLQLIPVAPPRLLAATGVVDAGRLLGYAIYAPNGLTASSQVMAMPSVHVAWSLWCAVTVVRASGSRWRWLVVLHPLITTAAVIATGYHFWLDAIVAAGLVVVAELLAYQLDSIGRPSAKPAAPCTPTTARSRSSVRSEAPA